MGITRWEKENSFEGHLTQGLGDVVCLDFRIGPSLFGILSNIAWVAKPDTRDLLSRERSAQANFEHSAKTFVGRTKRKVRQQCSPY